MTLRVRQETVSGYEAVVLGEDDGGYRGIVAIHNTVLGPAVGGIRALHYVSPDAGLTDVLRLSRAMSLKCALAGVPFGGGKSVIILAADHAEPTRDQLLAHGRLIESLAGRYVGAEDVGTTPRNLEVVGEETRFIAGLSSGKAGDPAPYTARGVLRGIESAVCQRLGATTLMGCRIAIQGCGAVGSALAALAAAAGARLMVADVDEQRALRLADTTGAHPVPVQDIVDCDADVFAPCALGGVLNDDTVRRLRVAVVAGAANNQLADDRHDVALSERGVFYAPDFVINSGGMLSGMMDLLDWSREQSLERIDNIGGTLARVSRVAREKNLGTSAAAVTLAEEKIAAAPASAARRSGR